MVNIKQIKDQSAFILTLVKKLTEDISRAELTYDGIKDYTRKREDIRRIRRELTELSHMLSKYD